LPKPIDFGMEIGELSFADHQPGFFGGVFGAGTG
jgi:hypothetical protein